MRILHVQRAKGIGGSERHLLDLIPGLRGAGLDARLLVLAAEGAEPFLEALRQGGVPHAVAPAGADLSFRTLRHIQRARSDFDPDVLHTHLIHADLHGAMAGSDGIPRVSTMHSAHAFYAKPPYRSATKVAWRQTKRLIAISDFVARFAESNRLIVPDRLTIIPYGVDPQSWSSIKPPSDRFGISSDAFVASMTGRLVKGKGHASAIAAIRPVVAAGVDLHLLLAGEGEESSALLTAARQQDVSDRVHMLGFLDDVRPVLAASDVSLFLTEPALSEGFGLAALEAMASGVPVIATRTGPLPWLVDDTGALVGGPTDPPLNEAIVWLARDDSLLQGLREASIARAANFSIDSMVKSTIRVYEEATS